MSDTTVTKVDSRYSPVGKMGQKYLAAGVQIGMRLWIEEPSAHQKPKTARDYETVGYCIDGAAELHINGQMVLLESGDSWVVPRGAVHHYTILSPFTAVEATSPPAFVHGRDEVTAREDGLPEVETAETDEREEMMERAVYDL